MRCFLLVPLVAGALQAQTVTARPTVLLSAPTGREIATISRGSAVQPGSTRSGMREVTIEGYIAATQLTVARDSFPAAVVRGGARLRAAASASGAPVAMLNGGMGVHVVSRDNAWARVRRTGWVAASSLTQPAAPPTVARPSPARQPAAQSSGAAASPPSRTAPQAAPPPPSAAGAAPRAAPIDENALTPARATTLVAVPEGRAVAELRPGATATPLARDRGWVRVRVEGWVRESDMTAADTSLRSLSAADLRADPDGTRGRVVRWTVQVLAYRVADEVRRDLVPGEPYLLVRGPGDESALSYLVVPPPLVVTARALPAMATVSVIARVRTGRSDPAGVPVLEIRSLSRQ